MVTGKTMKSPSGAMSNSATGRTTRRSGAAAQALTAKIGTKSAARQNSRSIPRRELIRIPGSRDRQNPDSVEAHPEGLLGRLLVVGRRFRGLERPKHLAIRAVPGTEHAILAGGDDDLFILRSGRREHEIGPPAEIAEVVAVVALVEAHGFIASATDEIGA